MHKIVRHWVATIAFTAVPWTSPVFAYPTNFITRTSDKLFDGSNEFRFIGTAISTVHRNENDLKADYSDLWPTEYEIEDHFKALSQMGATATRIYVISHKRSEPAIDFHVNGIGIYSETGFVALDRVLQMANKYDVRVIIPLVDRWDFYIWGGTSTFADLSNLSGQNFYQNSTLRTNFKNQISYILNRVNTLTGVKYKDDKAILAWQLGNELNLGGNVTDEWSSDIAAYIKSVDGNHLVMDGRDEGYSGILNDPNIDIVDIHPYGLWDATTDIAGIVRQNRDATRGRKALIVSEFGYASTTSNIDLMNEVINDGTSGALLWTLRGHHRSGGFRSEVGFGVQGYRAYHWPGFATSADNDEIALLNAVRTKAFQIRGLTAPAISAPEPPVMLTATSSATLSWQGSAGASSYALDRGTSATGPWTTVASALTDDRLAPLYRDPNALASGSYYYRVRAANNGGTSAPSNVIGPVGGINLLVDDLADWSKVFSKTAVTLDSSNQNLFAGDVSRAMRNGTQAAEEIVYRANGIRNFEAETYHWPNETIADFTFQTSIDGVAWSDVTKQVTWRNYHGGAWDLRRYSAEDLPASNYLKVRWPATSGNFWAQQIGKMQIAYTGTDAGQFVVDDLTDFSKTYSHGNVDIDASNSSLFDGDAARARRNGTQTSEEIVWNRSGAKSIEVRGYFWPGEAVSDFTIQTSSNGTSWNSITPQITQEAASSGNWLPRVYKAVNLTGTNYIKVKWNNQAGQWWSPQIAKVTIGF